MTLIVSLHIPDGIILAGDSLATMMQEIQIEGDIEIDCPNCGHKHKITPKIPFPAPSTTFSYAQKVFPFLDKYGVGTYGLGMLKGKSIYFAVREFEVQAKQATKKNQPQSVKEAAEKIGNHLHNLLIEQLQLEGVKIDDIPEANVVLGFQIAGYDNDGARIYDVTLGKQVKYHEPIPSVVSQHGCAISGQKDVAQAIWSLYKKSPMHQAQFSNFSIQDAIEYAKFLIRATASHQQFSSQMPNVGGDIDIALVTPFEDFKWIQQKPLSKVLSDSR